MNARSLRWLLLAPLLAGCESAALPPRQAVEVYDFRDFRFSPPLVLRWESGTTVSIFIESEPARREVLERALAIGIAEWNRAALLGEYRLRQVSSIADADVLLRWSDEISPVDYDECAPLGARAETTFCLANPGSLDDGLAVYERTDGQPSRVKMLVTVLGSFATQPRQTESLVTHELGHVLGILQHSPVDTDLMSAQQLSRITLSARDAATIQVLYRTTPALVP